MDIMSFFNKSAKDDIPRQTSPSIPQMNAGPSIYSMNAGPSGFGLNPLPRPHFPPPMPFPHPVPIMPPSLNPPIHNLNDIWKRLGPQLPLPEFHRRLFISVNVGYFIKTMKRILLLSKPCMKPIANHNP